MKLAGVTKRKKSPKNLIGYLGDFIYNIEKNLF